MYGYLTQKDFNSWGPQTDNLKNMAGIYGEDTFHGPYTPILFPSIFLRFPALGFPFKSFDTWMFRIV